MINYLSEHFTLDEMQRSNRARLSKISNYAPPLAVDNLKRLCNEVLEPIRAAFGSPIYINSGYRSGRVNRLIGGAKNSYHLYGRAADITATDVERLKDVIQDLRNSGVISPVELIEYNSFIHLAL